MSTRMLAAAMAIAAVTCVPVLAQSVKPSANYVQASDGHHKSSATDARLAEIEQKLSEQVRSIESLQQQLNERNSKISELEQQLEAVRGELSGQQLRLKTAEASHDEDSKSTSATLNNLETVSTKSIVEIEDAQRRLTRIENPTTLNYKGIKVTPGGFIEAAGLWRSHNENADVISSFNGMPYNGSANASLTEFRGTARQSRLSLLAEGTLGSTKLSGYYETDFLGAAPTANENQSSSFNLRQRQLFGQAEFRNGWTITAGQTWSLITTNKKGIEARGEWVPATIDAQYVVGYNFARLMTARLTKHFGDHATVAFSAENPETLASSINFPANTFGFQSSSTGTPGSALSSNTSADVAPDFIAKVAFDPGWGHYEIKGLGRVFRDRITSTTNKTVGGGIGFAALLPVVAKKTDFIAEAMYGRGIGRFGDSTNADVTVRPTGSLVPLQTVHALAGFELHPNARDDVYAYFGDEYLGRAAYLTKDGNAFGYGSPFADNSGCSVAGSAGKCQANIRDLYEGTLGFWHRFYRGPMGTFQLGAQYEYVSKNTWSGMDSIQPKGIENIVMTSFRYYLP
jgi:TolA-binding protein